MSWNIITSENRHSSIAAAVAGSLFHFESSLAKVSAGHAVSCMHNIENSWRLAVSIELKTVLTKYYQTMIILGLFLGQKTN